MKSDVLTINYEGGEIQRVQRVTLDSFSELRFVKPTFDPESLEKVWNLYRKYVVPAFPFVFGRMLHFYVPEGVRVELSGKQLKRYGDICDVERKASVVFKEGLRIGKHGPRFLNDEARRLYDELSSRGAVRIVCGKLPFTKILPIGRELGLLSEVEKEAKLKVNSNFFVMDSFDVSTVYDTIGTPIGLMLQDGEIINPPLFEREALLVDRLGNVSVRTVSLNELGYEIEGEFFSSNCNSYIYSRPETKKTPKSKGTDIIVVGNRVVSVKHGGNTKIPSSGFVIASKRHVEIAPGSVVSFRGLSEYSFGIQVGNSIIVDGEKTLEFKSPFYNIFKPGTISYPPSLYPLDFEKARAPRIALGADRKGKPIIAWMEGASKLRHEPGVDSVGASLLEMADICKSIGMYNAINLDGGGSAQILVEGKRSLMISERNAMTNEESERSVPIGIMVK